MTFKAFICLYTTVCVKLSRFKKKLKFFMFYSYALIFLFREKKIEKTRKCLINIVYITGTRRKRDSRILTFTQSRLRVIFSRLGNLYYIL